MLWVVFVALLILWLLGVVFDIGGIFKHIVLIVGIAFVALSFIKGRNKSDK